jgi:uncharacterized protein YqjF (DUF2071 family)
MVLRAMQGLGEELVWPVSLLSDSFRQPEVLAEAGHRPWPMPAEPWFMGQTWIDLLFAHWRVPLASLEGVVPPQLTLDTYEGEAYLGITPFRVKGLRLRGTTPVPLFSSFPEINVRTYVKVAGKPGIYFLSLDAGSWAAALAARRSYRLPYFRSRIATAADEEGIRFEAERISGDGPAACFRARYGPDGERLPERPGSLERWLAERYCLYALDERRRVHRGEIHHPPWPLQPAWAEIEANTMVCGHGIALEGEPLLHFSRRQDVALWPIRPS